MEKKYYMAVDLGTSFIKTGVYTLDGILVASWSVAVPDERPAQGIFIQRGEVLYQAVCGCIRKTAEMLKERARDVCAIAFTGQMAGAIGVGEKWEDITTWSCSLDGRYLPYAQRQREQYGKDLFEISGTVAPVMCAKYEWFKHEFPEEHKKIKKYVMLNGYMIGRLSGIPVEEAKIDYSLITWTGMADIHKRKWSEKICKETGMEMSMLPEIEQSTCIGGYLLENAAKELGLQTGIPLILGAGDKVSGCVGAGVLSEGDMIFEAASYGAVSCRVKEVRPDYEHQRYDVIGAADSQGYYVHKYMQGSGITLDWFVKQFIKDADSTKEAFEYVEGLCRDILPGSGNMLAIGMLGGSAIPFDSEMRGLFMGHTWSHSKGHFYHALLEGFSYDLALTIDSIRRAYPDYAKRPIRLIGGGAKSSVWMQMLSDVTGCQFEWIDREDAALWGTAMLAAAGVGDLKDMETAARSRISVKRMYTPNENRNRIYRPYIRLYEEAGEKLHDLFQKLNAL